MKYEAPFGVSDPNSSYINGNPSTGTMGSIPPAASIENPQREIVNFIGDSGVTPTDADLHQLSKSVQSGAVTYAADGGTANFIAITPSPAVAGLMPGMRFEIKVAAANTGPVQLNVSNLGWQPVVHGDLTALGAGELKIGQLILVGWDGAHWQMLTGGQGGLILLTAPRTFYIDANIGSDTLYDGTQATINGTSGPFLTLQHAFNTVTKFNQVGYRVTIQAANGSYRSSSLIAAPIPNGSGDILVLGNTTDPHQVQFINDVAGSVLTFNGGSYTFDGVYFQATAPNGPDPGNCLWIGGSSTINLNLIAFGPCPFTQVLIQQNATCTFWKDVHLYGGAATHVAAYSGAAAGTYPGPPTPNLIIHNTMTFTVFAYCVSNGNLAPVYGAISYLSGAVVHGQRYNSILNGVIYVNGNGASYLPGDVAGTLSSGGQYL